MYVFWEFYAIHGINLKGEVRRSWRKSRVHKRDPYTTLRTACNTSIPRGATVIFEDSVDEVPENLSRCGHCFKKTQPI